MHFDDLMFQENKPLPSIPYRNIWGFGSIPESCKVAAFVDIGSPRIGENCVIQAFVSIPPGWTIGNNVFIGPGARFANDKYPTALNKDWDCLSGVVEDEAVIGMGALIGPGVRIGKGAVIGMGAVVTKDVPAGETWVGNPARKIEK